MKKDENVDSLESNLVSMGADDLQRHWKDVPYERALTAKALEKFWCRIPDFDCFRYVDSGPFAPDGKPRIIRRIQSKSQPWVGVGSYRLSGGIFARPSKPTYYISDFLENLIASTRLGSEGSHLSLVPLLPIAMDVRSKTGTATWCSTHATARHANEIPRRYKSVDVYSPSWRDQTDALALVKILNRRGQKSELVQFSLKPLGLN